ncbi:sodium-independent sulfate anion transporter-like isoform X1 [Pieris brassicae]|uniref:sodium-independent sulfate anion transporter-like isoform X1 n=1 Tax=Pieris brassicae TaxID=7116 RepID=UPI001E662175|nr:sodium-independent sulfate anion transporter-like isoform X1 [Pieris brassicae]
MDSDDPRQPLLGPRRENKFRRVASKLCSVQSWKSRLPITIWLPKYKFNYLIKDLIAGITVGCTSIPQGIAYSMVAGVPPQVGLYASIFPGMVYTIFGSSKDVCAGPTAILSVLIAKYVALSVDFAFFAAFMTGIIILLLGILQLGFLLDFISKPVISGFTTAAALQIGAGQLKALFRLSGSSGETFMSAIINFFKNISTIQLYDTLLGIISIILLYIIQISKIRAPEGSSTCLVRTSRAWVYVVSARNAFVVLGASLLAFALYRYDIVPFNLTGEIQGGLPYFGPPPFSTVVNNVTLGFEEMLAVFGPSGLVMPLVTILESVAIAKAFAGSKPVDGTQEMIAVGACNFLSSFASAMPATGSFTRTALNHASGVVTPAGSFFKACTVLLGVTLLSPAFFFIPRSTLAAVIIVAMISLIEVAIVKKLWKNSKAELCVWGVTILVGVFIGLEYGIAVGVAFDAVRALLAAARPKFYTEHIKVGNKDVTTVSLVGTLSYACSEHVVRTVSLHRYEHSVIVLDGRLLASCDFGVAENIITLISDLDAAKHRVLLWNFNPKLRKLFQDLAPSFERKFVNGPSIEAFVLGLETDRQDSNCIS